MWGKKKANQNNENQAEPQLAEINVLMCAGRRVDKTAIMAAIDEIMNHAGNTKGVFSTGRVLCDLHSTAKNSGEDSLAKFKSKRKDAFDRWESPFYYAEESTQNKKDGGVDTTATSALCDYRGEISLQMQKGGKTGRVASIGFKDPRGEDYTTPQMQEDVIRWMQDSQIVLMMVDMPRLMEYDENLKQGGYHKDFNKPEEITNLLKKAWQGNAEPRMVLFVPVKCELYLAQGRAEEMTERIQKEYSPLLKYLTESKNSRLYTTAMIPCETMGGLEFRKFVPYRDRDGNRTGGMRSVYAYRRKENGERYYEPHNCEQLVLYILRYVFGLRKQRQEKLGIFACLNRLPSADELTDVYDEIGKSMIREGNGFRILYDPMDLLH